MSCPFLVTAQYDWCPGDLEVCEYGWTEICFDFDYNFGYESIVFYEIGGSGTGGFSVTLPVVTDSNCVSFLVDLDIPDQGEYFLYDFDDPTIFCEGNYTTTDCYDFLISPPNNGCGNSFIFKSEEGVIERWKSEIYQVCKGDTLHFEVSPEDYPTTDTPNLPFTIDRLCLNNGYVINSEEYSFDIVWDTPGKDSLGLITYYSPNVPSSITGLNVEVLDTTLLDIQGEAVNKWQQICVGENVYLFTLSELNSSLKWEISDGRGFSGLNIDVPFTVPGIYTITLFNDNKCNCSIPDEYVVEVLAGEYTDIDCTGTTCEGNTHTYHSTSECDSYIWSISGNGLITDGGGPDDFFITIEWLSGAEGEVTLSTPGCFEVSCRETTTATIPLISNDLAISGPLNVCAGEVTSYSIPNYQGTNIQWSINGEGSILNGQSTNIINVKWEDFIIDGECIISVIIDNCALGCSADATLDVVILNEFDIIASDIKLCVDESLSVSTLPFQLVNWEITTPSNSTITTNNASTINEVFTEIGTYTIVATNTSGTTCNTNASTSVTVSEKPIPPSGIDGNTIVCKEGVSIYSIPNLGAFDQVQWEVNDGSLTQVAYTTTSRTLQYTWISDGPYQLSAKIIDGQTGCSSDSYDIQFTDSFYVVGIDTTCLYSQETYYLENYSQGDISWGISHFNAATIVVEDGNSATILWHQEGNFKVFAYHCAILFDMEVEVIDLDINVIYPDSICEGELASVQVIAPSVYTVDIRDNNGTTVSTNLNSSLTAGDYSVYIYDINGCEDYHEISIREYPPFEVEIFATVTQICSPITALLTSSVSPSGSYIYQWYLDDVVIPSGISFSYSASSPGQYKLEVTDQRGCLVVSNEISISVCCGGNSTGQPINVVSIDSTHINCYTRTFTVQPPYISTSFVWTIINLDSQTIDILSGITISYTFTEAGRYRIIVNGNDGCEFVTAVICGIELETEICETGDIFVVIPFVSDFNHEPICEGESLLFEDATSIVSGVVGLTYSWNFGDPLSGSNNLSSLQNPSHLYAFSGDYEVNLTVTDPATGCSSTTTKSISVLGVPEIDFEIMDRLCLGLETAVLAISTDSDLTYKWYFGDTLSGKPNIFFGDQAEYNYVITDEYMITLTATNIAGCETTITKSTRIVENTFWSGIAVDGTSPLCPGETATFTAPNAGVDGTYIWSNNETTRTIIVSETGQYSVTATNAAGCVYSPSPKSIYYFDLGQAIISGTKRTSDQEFITTYDSMTICKGGYFIMDVPHIPNVSYTWNDPSLEGEHIPYSPHFSSLNAGTYEYFVTIRDTLTDCEGTIGPYILNVLPSLENPIVASSPDSECANEDITLTVTNPIEGIKYLWSTGVVGESIIVNTPNLYFVQAISPGGCFRQSATKFIREGFGVRDWMSGCMETCFPMDVCITLYGGYTYDLYKNGIYVTTLDNSLSTLSLTEPGDYEVLSTNNKGCELWTEPLSLSASPQNHNVNGIVFLDFNEDGFYDSNDSLLMDVPVMLCNGNTVVDSTLTDITGSYLFEDLGYANLTTKIDISNLDQLLLGNVDSLLIFEDCDEEKVVNFPLLSICTSFVSDTTIWMCQGDVVEIAGNQYIGSQLDTITTELIGDCDSVLLIEVIEIPDPEINIITTLTCTDSDEGSVLIQNLGSDSLRFAINNGAITSDSLILNLAVGIYDLTVYNVLNCPTEFQFTITEVMPPNINIVLPNLCYDEVEGSILIQTLEGDSLFFSLDSEGVFSEDSVFTNVSLGDHSVYILDGYGCVHSSEFNLAVSPPSTIEIIEEPTCPDENIGAVIITPIASNSTLSYSLDINGPYQTNNVIGELGVGSYMLYFQDDFGCQYSQTFEIEEFITTLPTITPISACEGEQNGALSISDYPFGSMFKLEENDIYTDQYPKDLFPGSYTLYILYPNGCEDSIAFEINEFTAPTIDLDVKEACEDSDGGALILLNPEMGLQYSLDGLSFDTTSHFSNIEGGSYTLYVLSNENCIYEHPFEVLINPSPIVEIVTSNPCYEEVDGTVTIIGISEPNLLFSLDAINFTNDLSFNNLPAAEYTLTIENELGCHYYQSFTIYETPPPTITITVNGSCENTATGDIFISDISPSSMIFFDDEVITAENFHTDISAGIHTVKVIDSLNCEHEMEIEIPSNPPLTVDFPVVETDCINSELTLIPEIRSSYGSVNYKWNDNSISESLTMATSGEYSVTISDDCQSIEFDWNLEFSLEIDAEMIYLPNIFSPNNDGANDCFITSIHESINLISYNQIVFDRWGNKMFESFDISDCWDGMYKDKLVRPGVYVYITDILVDQCSEAKSLRRVGDVTVIR